MSMIDLDGCHNILEKDRLLIIYDVLHQSVGKSLHYFINKNNIKYKKIDY